MFGYTLKLVKKKDLEQKEMYEKVVIALNQEINDFKRWLKTPFKPDETVIEQATADIEGLHAFIDIYYKNKYSTPSNCMMLFANMDELRKIASKFIDLISDYAELSSLIPDIKKRERLGIDMDLFNEEYDKAKKILDKRAQLIVGRMISCLNMMSYIIENDVIQVMMGVDVMELYKDRLKRLPKNEKLLNDFGISFKVTSKSDKHYLDKEEYKNEQRSRT